jgi:hypothetical protein
MVYWIYIKYDSGIISNIVYMSLYIFKHSFHNSSWKKRGDRKATVLPSNLFCCCDVQAIDGLIS